MKCLTEKIQLLPGKMQGLTGKIQGLTTCLFALSLLFSAVPVTLAQTPVTPKTIAVKISSGTKQGKAIYVLTQHGKNSPASKRSEGGG